MREFGLRIAVLLLLGVVLGCGSAEPRRVRYPGHLSRPSELGEDFLLRHAITAQYRDRQMKFEAVLQKQGDELILVGLTPYGSRAFLLEQHGTDVKFTNYVPKELPFPPRYILLDVHRTFFYGLGKGPMSDGTHRAERHGEIITERWKGGRLRERTFRQKDGEPAGVIRVRYDGGMRGTDLPEEVKFENGWFGYDLSIEVVERRPL